jgi:serine/threonine protein kinase
MDVNGTSPRFAPTPKFSSMSDVAAKLSTALADRYQIARRLGEGGMATVYLAEDLKHRRNVALKVLRPELAAVLGAERFVQEIGDHGEPPALPDPAAV